MQAEQIAAQGVQASIKTIEARLQQLGTPPMHLLIERRAHSSGLTRATRRAAAGPRSQLLRYVWVGAESTRWPSKISQNRQCSFWAPYGE